MSNIFSITFKQMFSFPDDEIIDFKNDKSLINLFIDGNTDNPYDYKVIVYNKDLGVLYEQTASQYNVDIKEGGVLKEMLDEFVDSSTYNYYNWGVINRMGSYESMRDFNEATDNKFSKNTMVYTSRIEDWE